MKRYVSLCAVLAVVLAASVTPAHAQPASDEWQVYVAPYLMGAAMSGATTVRGRSVDVDVSASDVFSNLQFGAMGVVVARKASWGVGADLIWMALGTTVRDTNVDFNQGAFAFYGLREFGPAADVTFGARIKTLPATRVLVTVSGTTYYLSTNAFYKRVMNGAQETWVTVTPPAGVVFVPALPAEFEVVQLNTMYFTASGKYYVPYLSSDGKELYVMVDTPPSPPASGAASARQAATPQAAAPAPAVKSATAPAAPAAPIRTVAESFTVPQGTLVVVRLATEVSSATAHVGDRGAGVPGSGPRR